MSIISERIEGKIISVDIKSSNVSGATYDTEQKILAVRFNNGSIYEYTDVPWELFTKFRLADSQGAFLNANVKNKHPHKKVN